MSLDQKQIEWHPNKLLAKSSDETESDASKLEASLAYRNRGAHTESVGSEDTGTADRRPRHGLIYDAPLGLKF